MRTCAAAGCDNPVLRKPRGRPAIYCSPSCRPRRPRSEPIVVEVDHPDTSPDGRAAERVWTVRLRRGQRVVLIAEGLGRPSANALVEQLNELLTPGQKGAAID